MTNTTKTISPALRHAILRHAILSYADLYHRSIGGSERYQVREDIEVLAPRGVIITQEWILAAAAELHPGLRPMTDAELVNQLIYSYVARADEDAFDEDPEVTIRRTLASLSAGRYVNGLDDVAEECRVPSVDSSSLAASAWAGRARWALHERDRAIRAAVVAGQSQRSVAAACGMTQPAVARILVRAGADGTRW